MKSDTLGNIILKELQCNDNPGTFTAKNVVKW